MDPGRYPTRPNPRTRSSLLSRIFFSWIGVLIDKGNNSEIKDSDLYDPLEEETVRSCHDQLNKEWKMELVKHRNDGNPSLRIAMFRAYGRYYLVTGIFLLTEDIISMIQPFLFGKLMAYFTKPPSITNAHALYISIALCFCMILFVPVNVTTIDRLNRSGIQWQMGLGTLIYRKICRLSDNALMKTTTGHIVNLMTNDVAAIDNLIWGTHYLLLGPLEAVLLFWLVYDEVGASVFVGFAFMAFLMPLQSQLGRLCSKYRLAGVKHTDERVCFISEIVSGMRAVKMYCWEKLFGSTVHRSREQELHFTWKSRLTSDVFSEWGMYQSKLLPAVVLLVFAWSNPSSGLLPAKIFPTMSYFFIINESLLQKVPQALKTISQVGVSLDRIQKFLLLPERETHTESLCNENIPAHQQSSMVYLDNVSVRRSEVDTCVLQDISFSVKSSEMLMVIGPVGCGKSTLLSVLLGEVPACQGSVITHGSVGYVPQEPWVFSSTIRQNILFGEAFDADRFAEVVRICELEKDLESLPLGVHTRVGEKGVTLSGGQKARVNLARALYMDAAFYLLDDPLSAVDAHTGRRIFERCINGYLKNKPRILVTHELQYLHGADKILILNEGKISAYGTYEELQESGIDMIKLVAQKGASVDDKSTKFKNYKDKSVLRRWETLESHGNKSHSESHLKDHSADKVCFTTLWTFCHYLRAGASRKQLFFLLGISVLTQVCYNSCDWWLAIWSREEESILLGWIVLNSSIIPFSRAVIYAAILTTTLIVIFCKNVMFAHVMTSTSSELHSSLYAAVLRAPIRFFDTTKTGNILSRFAKDIAIIDDAIPTRLHETMMKGMVVIGNTLVVLLTNPVLIIPAIPMMLAVAWIRHRYAKVKTPASQLVYKVLNPVISHCTATIQGLHVIRSCGAVEKCIQEFDMLLNHLSGNLYSNVCLYNWFNVRTNITTRAFACAIVLGCLFGAKYLDPSSVGLIMSTTVPLLWFVLTVSRLISELEVLMTSVNRVHQFSKLAPEGAEVTSYRPPSRHWPHSGNINFENVSFAYTPESNNILQNLNFEIHSTEKIGIVGRTGAGKSSLFQAMFRMAEPTGKISIDGVDCLKLGLHDLRSSLCIIHQDPLLFRGNLRMNLDAFGMYSDMEIWMALDQVYMRQSVKALPKGLDHVITEGGSNFSAGQRQLICLARAILRRQKILMLDEATANVDNKTDQIIQNTIRLRFTDCTVLTIAHRLNTVIDSDRIMVIHNGRIVEFASPQVLINNQNSMFSKLLQETDTS